MRNKISIHTILRKDKIRNDGKAPLNIQIIINGKSYKRGTNEFIYPDNWNKETKKVKKSVERSGIINGRIMNEINGIEDYLFKLERTKKSLSIDDVRDYYNPKKKAYLLSFFEERVEVLKNQYAPSTLKSYNTTFNQLKEFTSDRPILISDVDYRFIVDFDTFLRTEKSNTTAGVFVKHKCLKAVLREAFRQGLIERVPYENYKLGALEGRKVFLTVEEIEKLKECEIPVEARSLEVIRDMYLFSCYTGLRISDVTNLKWSNIEGDTIKIEMIKTRKPLITGLIKITREIINKYRMKPGDFVFPKKAHQTINKKLKDLAGLAKIRKNLSFHSARHTFASLLANNKDFSVNDIKDFLGHDNITVTENYIHSLDENRITKLKVLDEDKKSKEELKKGA